VSSSQLTHGDAPDQEPTRFGMHVSREPIDPSFFDEGFDAIFERVWTGPRWQFRREPEGEMEEPMRNDGNQ